MTKDVLITIRGVHTLDHEDNDVEMIVRGDYYQKNGKHYILYEEILEGAEERVKNVIKISPSSMDIIKKGVTNSRMLFEKNKKEPFLLQHSCGQSGDRHSGQSLLCGRAGEQHKGQCRLFPGH